MILRNSMLVDDLLGHRFRSKRSRCNNVPWALISLSNVYTFRTMEHGARNVLYLPLGTLLLSASSHNYGEINEALTQKK